MDRRRTSVQETKAYCVLGQVIGVQSLLLIKDNLYWLNVAAGTMNELFNNIILLNNYRNLIA